MSSREVGKSGSREESQLLSTHAAQRAPAALSTPRRVLVVKLADIGDALGTLPAVRALRATFPEARIDALVTPGPAREVFDREPAVDAVLTFAKGDFDAVRGMADPQALRALIDFGLSLRRQRYDAAILFHHLTTTWGARKFRALALATGAPIVAGLDNGRGDFLTHATRDAGFGAKAEWAYWLDVVGPLGAFTADTRPTFPVTAAETSAARALIDERRPYVVLHPGVGGYAPARQWPVARLAAVGAMLATDGYALVITGGRDAGANTAATELRAALGATPALDLTGTCDLGTTAAVYADSALFIGSDSGMAHLAAAVGAACIAVFGPSNHRAWAPYDAIECNPGSLDIAPGARVVVLRSTIPCSPCFYTGYTLGRPNGCPSRSCLLDVQANDVYVVANQLLNRTVTGASITS